MAWVNKIFYGADPPAIGHRRQQPIPPAVDHPQGPIVDVRINQQQIPSAIELLQGAAANGPHEDRLIAPIMSLQREVQRRESMPLHHR